MKVLVTGAAGFIGGNLMSKLLSESVDCLGIDSFSSYYSIGMKNERVRQLGYQSFLRTMDINNREEIEDVFQTYKPTHVVHLAAQGGVRVSKTDPLPYLESNQIGFHNILSASEKHSVTKFLYASSSSVYSDGLIQAFKESDPLAAPKSLYALSKLSNEIISSHLPVTQTKRIGLRFFTVYGPWGRPDMAVFRFLASAMLRKDFCLTAELNTKRDFTFVEDVSKTIYSILKSIHRNLEPEIFNVAGGSPYTMAQLFSIANSLGVCPTIINDEPDSLDVQLTYASIEKLELNNFYVPNISLQLGLSKTWDWMTSQEKANVSEWYNQFVKI